MSKEKKAQGFKGNLPDQNRGGARKHVSRACTYRVSETLLGRIHRAADFEGVSYGEYQRRAMTAAVNRTEAHEVERRRREAVFASGADVEETDV